MRVEHKHVVVTGGASGIGRALALRFSAEDARGVIVADLDAGRAEAVAGEIGDRAHAVACDVARPQEIAELIAASEERFGPIDVFCANAGIGGGTGLLQTTEAEWDQALAVNLRSHVTAARLLVPGWLQRGQGYFLSTASAAGLLTVIGSAPYAVTKHAAVAFAEWLAVTYGGRGVGVGCLCPMAVQTDLLQAGLDQPGEAGLGMQLVTQAGDVLDPEQVADAVIAGMADQRFLILPHPEVQTMFAQKASDHDRWIAGMQAAQAAVAAG